MHLLEVILKNRKKYYRNRNLYTQLYKYHINYSNDRLYGAIKYFFESEPNKNTTLDAKWLKNHNLIIDFIKTYKYPIKLKDNIEEYFNKCSIIFQKGFYDLNINIFLLKKNNFKNIPDEIIHIILKYLEYDSNGIYFQGWNKALKNLKI